MACHTGTVNEGLVAIHVRKLFWVQTELWYESVWMRYISVLAGHDTCEEGWICLNFCIGPAKVFEWDRKTATAATQHLIREIYVIYCWWFTYISWPAFVYIPWRQWSVNLTEIMCT